MTSQPALIDSRMATPARGSSGVQRATSRREMDEMVERLRAAAGTFARLSIAERIRLARDMQAGYLRIAERSVRAACTAKGISPSSPLAGEEWSTGPWSVVRHLRLVAESLESLQRTGTTPLGALARAADGAVTARVFPANRIDGVLFSGVTCDVRFLPGVTEDDVNASRASFYRSSPHGGRVVLVLGAGNLAAIGPMDVVTKMFNEGKVCVLKMNPVNDYLAPLIEEAFAEAIRRDFLAVVYGGADEGAYLVAHPGTDEIHLTGSDRTYEQIVWGPPGPEREARKARNVPLTNKPVTAELGNISPVLVVPGPYSDRELAFQAGNIAGAAVHNASCNCDSARMLVTPKGWSKRDALLRAVERALADAPVRRAYYPGAAERWRDLTRERETLRIIGQAGDGELPWALVPGLDASDLRERAFTTEPFCSILSETEVGSDDPIEFLDRAVDFANNRLWGTLSADLVVHPRSLADPAIDQALESAIARLRYGAVTVNSWTGLIFVFGTPPWGAFPGSTPADIRSGVGWVHNSSMLERIEKAVLRQPLTVMPKPPTFPGHRTAHTVLRRLTYLDERASWKRVPGVVMAAMRG